MGKDNTMSVSKYYMAHVASDNLASWLRDGCCTARRCPVCLCYPTAFNAICTWVWMNQNTWRGYPGSKGDFHKQFMCNNNKMNNLAGSCSAWQWSLTLSRAAEGRRWNGILRLKNTGPNWPYVSLLFLTASILLTSRHSQEHCSKLCRTFQGCLKTWQASFIVFLSSNLFYIFF